MNLQAGQAPFGNLACVLKFALRATWHVPPDPRMMHPRIASNRLKTYYFRPPESAGNAVDYYPHYFFEAKIDIDDIRSGYHETRSVSKATEVRPCHADEFWTADMLGSVDPSAVQPEAPPGVALHPLPSYVTDEMLGQAEKLFVLYLMRHEKARFYRNYALKIYSAAGESAWDFSNRCLEMLNERFHDDLNGLREVINRRLELLRERFFARVRMDEIDASQWALRQRDCLSAVTERIDAMFLDAGLFSTTRTPDVAPSGETLTDLEEKLIALQREALREVESLVASYREKACNVDEYVVHPGLKDVHMVRTGMLWMPRRDLRS